MCLSTRSYPDMQTTVSETSWCEATCEEISRRPRHTPAGTEACAVHTSPCPQTLSCTTRARQHPCPRTEMSGQPWVRVVANNGHVFLHDLWHDATVCSTAVRTSCITFQISTMICVVENNGHVDNLVQELQLWASKQSFALFGPEHLSLHNDEHVNLGQELQLRDLHRDMSIWTRPLTHNNGRVNILSESCTCEIFTNLHSVALSVPVSACNWNAKHSVDELDLERLLDHELGLLELRRDVLGSFLFFFFFFLFGPPALAQRRQASLSAALSDCPVRIFSSSWSIFASSCLSLSSTRARASTHCSTTSGARASRTCTNRAKRTRSVRCSHGVPLNQLLRPVVGEDGQATCSRALPQTARTARHPSWS